MRQPIHANPHHTICAAVKAATTQRHTLWRFETREDKHMLWTIFVILLILWLLGVVSGTVLGGYIHILLVIAVVVLIIRLIQGRSVV
jgi:Family of unknown function (DUF5670)